MYLKTDSFGHSEIMNDDDPEVRLALSRELQELQGGPRTRAQYLRSAEIHRQLGDPDSAARLEKIASRMTDADDQKRALARANLAEDKPVDAPRGGR